MRYVVDLDGHCGTYSASTTRGLVAPNLLCFVRNDSEQVYGLLVFNGTVFV